MKTSFIFAAAMLLAAGGSLAQESKVQLKDGPGRDKANACLACHSLDYIQMNSRFLDKAGAPVKDLKIRLSP